MTNVGYLMLANRCQQIICCFLYAFDVQTTITFRPRLQYPIPYQLDTCKRTTPLSSSCAKHVKQDPQKVRHNQPGSPLLAICCFGKLFSTLPPHPRTIHAAWHSVIARKAHPYPYAVTADLQAYFVAALALKLQQRRKPRLQKIAAESL